MLVVTRCHDKSRDKPSKITSWRPSSWQPSWEQPSSSRLSWPCEESLSSLRVATALPPEPGEVKLQRCCHAEPNPSVRQPWRTNASLLFSHPQTRSPCDTSRCDTSQCSTQFCLRHSASPSAQLITNLCAAMLLIERRVLCLPVRFHSADAFPASMVSNSQKCASTF